MATMKIKKGDTVKVIAGADKGTEGKVIAVNHKNNTVLVEGVNMITKHTKPSAQNQQGGIVHQGSTVPAGAESGALKRGAASRKMPVAFS